LNWKGLFRFLKGLLLLGVLLGAAYWSVFRTDWFLITDFEVQANADERAWVEENYKTYFMGRHMFLVSLEEGADALRAEAVVRQARITRRLPHTLVYRIEYRLPTAAVWFDGMALLVDGEGYLVRTEPAVPEGMPVINGLKMDSFVVGRHLETASGAQYKTALELVSLMKSASLDTAAVITLEEHAVLVALNSGLKGRFWYRGSIEDSFNRFMAVYNDQVSKGVSAGLIDVSSEGYPVYKPFGE